MPEENLAVAPEDPQDAGLFTFGDEDEAIPEELIPIGTQTEMVIVGTPKIITGVADPWEDDPEQKMRPWAMISIRGLANDFPAAPFIEGTMFFPADKSKVRNFNRDAGKIQQFKQAVGWTPPVGLNPFESDGLEFPELEKATVQVQIGQARNRKSGELENTVSRWLVESAAE